MDIPLLMKTNLLPYIHQAIIVYIMVATEATAGLTTPPILPGDVDIDRSIFA